MNILDLVLLCSAIVNLVFSVLVLILVIRWVRKVRSTKCPYPNYHSLRIIAKTEFAQRLAHILYDMYMQERRETYIGQSGMYEIADAFRDAGVDTDKIDQFYQVKRRKDK